MGERTVEGAFGPVILGIFLMFLGANNMRGKIGSIHWYHRRRVREEDILPFGRLMGLGTVFCGAGAICLGLMMWLGQQTGKAVFADNGAAAVIAGLAAGLALSVYAMLKYNRGIF